jgi:hypothetical protein
MIRVLLAAALVVAALAVPATATGQTPERRCGDLGGPAGSGPPQNVRARGVSCKTARRLARRHRRNVSSGEPCDLTNRSCKLGAWTCRRTFFGNSGTRVRCTRGADRVRFVYGV